MIEGVLFRRGKQHRAALGYSIGFTILFCLLVQVFSVRGQAPPSQPPWSRASSSLNSLLPLNIPVLLQCSRTVYGEPACFPVRKLPSVSSLAKPDGSLILSGPDPSRTVWIEAIGVDPQVYLSDQRRPSVNEGVPPNYFCINLSPAIRADSSSGAGALAYAIDVIDGGVTRHMIGLIATGSDGVSGQLGELVYNLAYALPWPGTHGYPVAGVAGFVHYYQIGVGCGNYSAISFDPLPVAAGSDPVLTVSAAYALVSIP